MFSLYLQSRTQSTPFKMNNDAVFIPTQSTTNKRDEPQSPSQQVDDCCGDPQYFSNTVSVLPADRYGSYYIIYHRNASGECRDDFDETVSSSSTNGTRREYDVGRHQDFLEADLVANHSMIETKPKSIMYDKNIAGSSTPRSVQERSSPPAFTMLDDDEDYDDDDEGFVSFAAGACVACFIPVVHFIQFFMC
jgi:hypothetical protein